MQKLPFPRISPPTSDLQRLVRQGTEGADEGGGQARVRNKRNVEVHGGATEVVAVPQLGVREVLGVVDHEVHHVLPDEVLGGRRAVGRLVPLAHALRGYAMFYKVPAASVRGIELMSLFGEHAAGGQKFGLLEGVTRGQEHGAGGDAVTHRQHRL